MTHVEYLMQLIRRDRDNLYDFAAKSEVSVSGSSEPDAVARWIAREWILAEGFDIVRPGNPVQASATWRRNGREEVKFDTASVEVRRLDARTLQLSVFFTATPEDRQLGPAHQVLGRLSQVSGRQCISRPLPPTRQGPTGGSREYASSR